MNKEELSTLKDIEFEGRLQMTEIARCDALREEAIKHIKVLQKEEISGRKFVKENTGKEAQINESLLWKEAMINQYNYLIVNWIRKFFNITEEELKW